MISFRDHDTEVTLEPGSCWPTPLRPRDQSYRDTAAEEIWAIIADITAGEPWRECLRRRIARRDPWLHRIVTGPERDLFFRQHPPKSGALVLDIGAGWGQIALPLARTHLVTALEPTPERLAFIQAAAKQDGCANRLACVQADFLDATFATRFDLVCCIGVLEWVPKFRAGPPRKLQRDFLAHIRALLAPGGELVVGIENRLGLKYLLGARDDHTGTSFIHMFEAELAARKFQAAKGEELRVLTHSLAEYSALFREAGFSRVESFAAFPDYKLPQLILPLADTAAFNARLEKERLPDEHDGVDGTPLPNQEELRSLYRSLAHIQVAHGFAPSYVFVCR